MAQNLATGSGEGDRAARRSRCGSTTPAEPQGDRNWVRFSPDGRPLAVSSLGYTQLWDVGSRRPIGAPLGGHEGDVAQRGVPPDGGMLATSGFDGTVILWDVELRRTLGRSPGSSV